MSIVDVVVGSGPATHNANIPRICTTCGADVFVSEAGLVHVDAGAKVLCLNDALALALTDDSLAFAWTGSGLQATVAEAVAQR